MKKINNFLDFIKENLVTYRGYATIGEYIEHNFDNDTIKELVNSKIKDIDTSVNISNAVNSLTPDIKMNLYNDICEYLDNDTLNESLNDQVTLGKNIFKTFLRLIAALGLKENNPSWDLTPSEFLIYYQFDNIKLEQLKLVMSRFKSLTPFIERLTTNSEQKLYFGIKTDMDFEYGILSEERNYMGKFKLSKSSFNWLMVLDNSSATSLKRELSDLSLEKISLLNNIKKDLNQYVPGKYRSKTLPTVKDNIMTLGYYGIGRWDNGELNQDDLNKFKSDFKEWGVKKKWHPKVLISINANEFWTYYNIKIK